MNQAKQGQLIQADFFMNSGGLNNTDTPFAVKSGQATAGFNYEYLATGGITKRNGHTVVNSTPDTQLRSLGYSLNTTSDDTKTVLRAAGTKIQSFDALTGVTTDIAEDTTAASTNLFTSGTTQPVVFSQFTNPSATVTWFAGGEQATGAIHGFVGGKYTQNGVASATGVITLTSSVNPFLTTTADYVMDTYAAQNVASLANVSPGIIINSSATTSGTKVAGIIGTTVVMSLPATASGSAVNTSFYGGLPDATLYYYAVSLSKGSTTAEGNAALDVSIVTGASGFGTAGGNTVTLDLSGITGVDTTKYTHYNIYRSSVSGGAPGFTIGDLIATIPSTSTSYIDYGAVQQTAAPVPRNGNQVLDNSPLPSTGVFTTLTKWKNKLVTTSGSTVYLSDINKAESWPSLNFINVPSGGSITALGIISYVSPTSASTDELLVIFKEREIWTLSGSSLQDWTLLFVDYVGCIAQPLLVFANGFLFWVDYRGIFLYDGSNKPVYLSRLIEYDFSINGDLDLSKLPLGNGDFFRKQNEIIWFLSSSTLGEQRLAIKLDLRLSMPNVQSNFSGRIAEAIFIKDSQTYPIYACCSLLPTFEGTFLNEIMFAGDDAGNILNLFNNGDGDGPNAINFSFRTKIEDFGSIGTAKRFHKVVVWCRQSTANLLGLKYFLNYKTDDPLSSAFQSLPIAAQFNSPIWDVSVWDQSLWDTGAFTYGPIVFNLGNPTIGIEGDALTLEFEQGDYQSPVTIIGYSVIYSLTGLRK